MNRPPIPGLAWRVGAGGTMGQPPVGIYSRDYPDPRAPDGQLLYTIPDDKRIATSADLDEVAVVGLLHLERMNSRDWHLSIGEHHINIRAERDGTVTLGNWFE
jgi:hypothetical protein